MKTKKSKNLSETGEFFSYALPAVISMLLSASIVIIDSIFIGQAMGHTGLASVNLTLPVFYVFLGISIMISVGGSVMASRERGRGRQHEGSMVFSNTLTILFLSVTALLLLIVLFFEPVLNALKAGDELYLYTRQYLGTIRWFYPLSMVSIGLSVFIRAEGKPALSMMFSLCGNLLNIAFDYLFIMKFGWELRGAALASGMAILIPLTGSAAYFLSSKSWFSFKKPSLQAPQTRMIFINGSSEMISQFSVAFTTWLFNMIILKNLGINGLAAFTIAGYLIFIETMIINGLATGLGPVIGFHYGAGHTERMKRLLHIALVSGFTAGLTTWVIVILSGSSLATAITGGNSEIGRIAQKGYWLFTSAFLFNGFNVLMSAFFTSLGAARHSLIISGLRGLVLNSLGILILPELLGEAGIWLSFPLAEVLTLITAFVFLKRSSDKLLQKQAA